MAVELMFAKYAPKNLEPKNSIGAKWLRLLDTVDLASVVAGKRTAIKLHLGGNVGFTSIHPFFVRKLVDKIKQAGAAQVFATDGAGAVRSAVDRGYTQEVLGCQIVPVSGTADRYFYTQPVEPPFLSLSEVELAGEIVDAEALIDLSHVKGHGDCGFGGASKNLSMGAVTGRTRGAIHGLEGGLVWDEEKCVNCGACVENCPNGAMSFDKQGKLNVFYHHCKFCQHCVLICPEKAIRMEGGRYKDFQKGMALATTKVLETFQDKNVLYINFLVDVTIFCDCWGMTTPAIVPDIGILAGRDIVAVEQASLDMIRMEDLIPGSLPEGTELGDTGHLFERIHRKDPYVVIDYLEELGNGTRDYVVTEVE
ncbi:MAG: DUF362 domain-containing protein [Planctomycetes bacterium]|nr:DUF362 domain-containing protein [Planctomycetota bacterium]